MYKEIFQNRIKQTRLEIGLSQNYVSEQTGINQSKISKFETGKLEPSIEQLGKLAEFYNVSIDFLLGNTPQKYKEWRINDNDGTNEDN